MRVPASVVAVAAVAISPLITDAFVPTASIARNSISLHASSSGSAKATVCEIPSEFGSTPSLVGVPNGATSIRSAVVINSAGDFVRIDDAMRSGTADDNAPNVVIFLRHMG